MKMNFEVLLIIIGILLFIFIIIKSFKLPKQFFKQWNEREKILRRKVVAQTYWQIRSNSDNEADEGGEDSS